MKPFENETTEGNELAIRRGPVVPEGAVNLAWSQSPKFTPSKNMIIVDTSQVVEENIVQAGGQRKLMFANSIGILEDIYGNQLIDDEFPVVSDTFSVNEDFSIVPGSEYTDHDVLPFVHRSRHFHVDFPGLTLSHDMLEYKTQAIKVVDGHGRDYVDEDGLPRYKIKIVAAFVTPTSTTDDQAAYRVYAFVDTENNEDLYLQYNKIEVDGGTGNLKNHVLNYQEILNPISYFSYTPEESEVVDPASRNKKIYSTRPLSLKQEAVGAPLPSKNGYKVYVPKKALTDPRIFQLFRWRVSCSFVQQFKVDPNTGTGIRAGIVVTNSSTSRAPYAFLNLSRSQYNATQARFYNPLWTNGNTNVEGTTDQETASYWQVNFDTITYDQLAKYDILIWSPQNTNFNFAPYYGKIEYFVNTLGGTLFIDTNNYTTPSTIYGNVVTNAVSLFSGDVVSTNTTGYCDTRDLRPDVASPFFDADQTLGGWDFNDGMSAQQGPSINDEYNSISNTSTIFGGKSHYINTVASGWTPILRAKATTGPGAGTYVPVVAFKNTVTTPNTLQPAINNTPIANLATPAAMGRGVLILSTIGIAFSCNALVSNVSATWVDSNLGSTLFRTDNYKLYINSSLIEGAMKFLFNLSLGAVRGRVLDDTDERSYSSSWTFSTDWKSSWVIKAGDGVLSDEEIQENDFAYLPKSVTDPTPVWQRKLLYGDNSKTMKQLMDSVLTPDMKKRIEGATRTYVIEVTNSKVQVPSTLGDNSYPYAWTEEYTPKFTIPVELGPHIVRSEDVKGRFAAGQYVSRTYPAKPYSGQVRVIYNTTEEFNTVQKVAWSVTGTATETITTGVHVPPSSTTTESEVALNWANNSNRIVSGSSLLPEFGAPQPWGITTWQYWNYHNSAWGNGIYNWPDIGLWGQWGPGSSGDVVSWIQDALNLFAYLGFFASGVGALVVDGRYGPSTTTAMRNFQITFNARYIDGVTDAESLSILGAQCLRAEYIIRTSRPYYGYYQYYYWALDRIRRQYISDGNVGTAYAKRSWVYNGPVVIWDMFQIVFDKVYPIHGVTFTPLVEGYTPTLMFRSIDIRTQPHNLINYDSRTGDPIWMPYRPRDNQSVYIPFNPRWGDTLIIGIGQDGGNGAGTSRSIGIRDISAHARVSTTVTIPGVDTIKKQTKTITISCAGTSFVTSRQDITVQLHPNYTGSGVLTNVVWGAISKDNANVTASLIGTEANKSIKLSSSLVTTDLTTSIVTGSSIPSGGTYYAKTTDGVRGVGAETGWVSKADGIKLLCNSSGQPYGFPTVLPTNIGANESQRHYTKFSLVTYMNDVTVQMGFWDNLRKEFIVNPAGEPEMTYIEWAQRGPSNIYIGVFTTYETTTNKPLPPADDAPTLPYKWAMPVYGIYQRRGSKIALDPLPENLGVDEMWPVAVRTGKFSRFVNVRPRSAGVLTGYIKDYQGTTVQAFYRIPEAEIGGWSAAYGPPNRDIVDEVPLIIDSDVLQIRQPGVLMAVLPTVDYSDADPLRPIFVLYHRDTLDDDWERVPWADIRDYNVSTGEIFLRSAMTNTDPRLWKVSYTSSRPSYLFKEYNGTVLNFNPYLPYADDFLGKTVYIYMVPEYVRDNTSATITSSIQASTLRFTLDPSVFSVLSPNYDPLAIQLGAIYLSTSTDLRDLVLLDTRRRGGGARDGDKVTDINTFVAEAVNYWDIAYGSGQSYQKGGFIIVRLPEELQDSFTEAEIRAAIERNLTVGVRYKIEDLSGNEWVES
jgi:hypothetical protein